MAYENAIRLLELVEHLQTDMPQGMTICEIANFMNTSERNAQRIRKALATVFALEDKVDENTKVKKWSLIDPDLQMPLRNLMPEHVTALQMAIKTLDRENIGQQSKELTELSAWLNAWIQRKESKNKFNLDLGDMLTAQGLANKPGPKEIIKEEIVVLLRHAVLACQRVRITYNAVSTGKTSVQTVCPYGFLYGTHAYLVCFSEGSKDYPINDFRNLRLANIEDVKLLDKDYFEAKEDFDINDYAKESFGSFRREPRDIKWRFSPDAARDAKNYIFHPDQKITEDADGSLTVEFTAMGDMELCWHLFMWGDGVEILEPADLKEQYANMLRTALNKVEES